MTFTNSMFHAWCLHNTLTPETQAYIERIRQSQPVRKVRNRASNVSGRYPSVGGGSCEKDSQVEIVAMEKEQKTRLVHEY